MMHRHRHYFEFLAAVMTWIVAVIDFFKSLREDLR